LCIDHFFAEFAEEYDSGIYESDPKNVYIGRAGIVFIDGQRFPKKESIWANPFKIGRDGDRHQIILNFEKYIKDKLSSGKISLEELRNLRNKNLGCWCVPFTCHECPNDSELICHGQILLRLLK
jgi:hypothetical protein